MATHYTSTTVTKYHSNYGVYGDYKKVWYQFAITVTISAAGAVTYSITSTNNVNAIKGWSGCQTSAWIEINGTTILAADVYSEGFPRNNNTTKTGSAGTTTTGSVTIKTKIIPGSDYTGWEDEWNKSLITSTVSRSYWEDNTLGTPTIVDNRNNTFTVTPGRVTLSGTDPVKSIWSYYQIRKPDDTAITDWILGGYKKDSTSLDAYTISLPIGSISDKKVKVVANTQVIVTYGGATVGNTAHCISSSDDETVSCYKAPGEPGKPKLTSESFRNGRLTVKQNWKYTWTPAEAKGASGVAGYRIRIYNTVSSIKGLTYSNGIISKGNGTADYVDTESDNNSITFDPTSLGFIPGNTIEMSIFAYSKNGKNQTFWNTSTTSYNLFSGGGYTSVYSDTTPVQNTGIMRIKLTNTGNAATDWKEGQVLVKVNNTGNPATDWKEADEVKIKTADGWATAE